MAHKVGGFILQLAATPKFPFINYLYIASSRFVCVWVAWLVSLFSANNQNLPVFEAHYDLLR